MARTISDTVTEICALRHGIENAAWEEARGKLMAYLRLRGSCFGGDQEEYDALKYEIESFINRIDEGDIYQQETDELTRLRAENKKLRVALKPFAEMLKGNYSYQSDDMLIKAGANQYDLVFVFALGDLRAAAAAIRKGGGKDDPK